LGYLLKMFGIRKKRDQTIPLSFVQWMEIARNVRFTDIVSMCIMPKWNRRSVNGYDGLNSSKSMAMPASYA
jgi:hypothetical protein